MVEDKILILKFKHGRSQALERIYQKYKEELLSLATDLNALDESFPAYADMMGEESRGLFCSFSFCLCYNYIPLLPFIRMGSKPGQADQRVEMVDNLNTNPAIFKDGWFPTTHWSTVIAAGKGDSPQAADALDRLCRTY